MSAKFKKNLTPKQTKLVNTIVKQVVETGETNLRQAGLETFDTNNPNSAAVMAHRELKNANVKSAIDQALTTVGITTDGILKNVKKIAESELPDKISAETILKANVEALKILGAYPTAKTPSKTVNNQINIGNLNFSEAKQRLEELSSESSKLLKDLE